MGKASATIITVCALEINLGDYTVVDIYIHIAGIEVCICESHININRLLYIFKFNA